jgi:PilZ domain-containing protein
MLDTAVSVLATLPKKLDVLSEDGGTVTLEILGHDADCIQALAPVHRVRIGLRLRMRQRDEHGAGHDIDLRVADIFYESDRAATLQLTVERLRRRSGQRTSPRARLSDLALVSVLYSPKVRAESEFDVHLTDLSADGLAFVTDKPLRAGDLLSVMPTIDRRLVRLRARVLHTAAAHYGRRRIGCEVVEVAGSERARLAVLATMAQSSDSASERLARSA